MGMIKKGSAATAPAPVAATPAAEAPKAAAPAANDNGTAAAISRLKKKTDDTAAAPAAAKTFTGRDYAEEARGKTRCVQFEAALMSPAIAGMKFENMAEYLKLCKEAADFGTAYTFGE